MNVRLLVLAAALFSTNGITAAEPSHKITTVAEIPKGLSAKITAALDPKGIRVAGPDGPVCDIWLLKNLPLQADFQPSLSVKYPFTQGQLIGAMRVPEDAEFTDFREQEIGPGLYTLRYGQQPSDGNHIGTSDLADFLLALPAQSDADASGIDDADLLAETSAESAGSTHPAIFSLLPTKPSKTKGPSLTHDEERDLWILRLDGNGTVDGKKILVPIRLVVIGFSDV